MRKSFLTLGGSCVALAVAGQAAAQALPSQTIGSSALAGAEPAAIDPTEIIVTATRRSENIREVPTAMSAYNGAKLNEAQIASLSDLTSATPNLQISSSGTSVNINIRGVGNGNLNQAGGEPGVAVQSDGVYLGQPGLAVTTLLDVARVEILRGPQGTLSGRNATGGAINIIPNTPTRDLSYGADLTVGADPALVRSSAYVSGPVSADGTLRGRISVGQNYGKGYTKNLAPDGPSRLDDHDDVSVRGQLQWQATEDLSFRLLTEYQKEQESGPAAFLLGTPGNTPLPKPLQGFPIGNPGSREAYANFGFKKLDAKTVNLIADWQIGDGNLKALASYNRTNQRFLQDGDGSLASFTNTLYANKAEQEYGELIYTSDPSQPFTYVIGSNFYEESFRQNIQVDDVELPFTFSAGGKVDTRSYAFFGHAQYAFMGAKIFGGIRYTDDRKKVDEFNNFVGSGRQSASWNHVTFDAGVLYDFSRSVAGYVKYATGYKSGGFATGNIAAPFEPETNSNLEAGLKGSFLNGGLQANLAAFHMSYRNLQVNQIVGFSAAITNAAQAKIDGIEIETIMRPFTRLRIEASAAWLKARFDRFQTADSARPQVGTLDLSGNDLPNAPRVTASLGVYYAIPVQAGTVTPAVRYDWKSKLYFTEFNLPISSQDAAGTLNLFLNYKSESGRWSGSVFALNAAGKTIKSNVLVVSALLGSLALGQYKPDRQVGASIGYHF